MRKRWLQQKIKKMKPYLILLIGMCYTMTTCKKDDTERYIESIIIGSESNLLVNSYDIILHGTYNVPASIDLDVNGDDEPDYRLLSEYKGSTGLGFSYGAKIFCLNSDCLINGYSINDTSYIDFKSDTTYNDENVTIQNSYIYSCNKFYGWDYIEVLPDQFHINHKNNGDILYKDVIFQSGTITLNSKYSSGLGSAQFINDTIIYNYYSYINTCSFPSDSIKYIGIKIIDNNIEKIGWIKICISDIYIISIFESAIQR
jgi:hypothetical protein